MRNEYKKNQYSVFNTLCSERKRNSWYINNPHTASLRGFSMIETIVLLAVFTVIIMAIVSSIRFVYRGQRFAFEQADATRSARIGVEKAVRSLREMSYADNGAYPVVSMATTSVTFYSDYDNDKKIERIRYFLDGTNFKKGTTESSGNPPTYNTVNEIVSSISDNVRNNSLGIPIFTYYNKSGILMSNLNDVGSLAFVVVRIIVNLYPDRVPGNFELRSAAALRNIK